MAHESAAAPGGDGEVRGSGGGAASGEMLEGSTPAERFRTKYGAPVHKRHPADDFDLSPMVDESGNPISGHFSEMYFGRHKESGRRVAVKRIRGRVFPSRGAMVKYFETEFGLHNQLMVATRRSPFLVELVAGYRAPPAHKDGRETLFVVTALATGGDFIDWIMRNPRSRANEDTVRAIGYQASAGLFDMHHAAMPVEEHEREGLERAGVRCWEEEVEGCGCVTFRDACFIHRDIKPDNIFIVDSVRDYHGPHVGRRAESANAQAIRMLGTRTQGRPRWADPRGGSAVPGDADHPDPSMRIVLGDFGAVVEVDPLEFRGGDLRGAALPDAEHHGTPSYNPPEAPYKDPMSGHMRSGSWSSTSDMWQLAASLVVPMTGDFPFKHARAREIFNARMREHRNRREGRFNRLPDGTSEDLTHFVTSALQVRMSDRLRTKEALRHPWLEPEIEAAKEVATPLGPGALLPPHGGPGGVPLEGADEEGGGEGKEAAGASAAATSSSTTTTSLTSESSGAASSAAKSSSSSSTTKTKSKKSFAANVLSNLTYFQLVRRAGALDPSYIDETAEVEDLAEAERDAKVADLGRRQAEREADQAKELFGHLGGEPLEAKQLEAVIRSLRDAARKAAPSAPSPTGALLVNFSTFRQAMERAGMGGMPLERIFAAFSRHDEEEEEEAGKGGAGRSGTTAGAEDKVASVVDICRGLAQLTNPTEQTLSAVFKIYDLNGDGRLSLPEVAAVLRATRTGDVRLERTKFDRMAQLFGSIDSDGDGKITFEEFKGAVGDSKQVLDAFLYPNKFFTKLVERKDHAPGVVTQRMLSFMTATDERLKDAVEAEGRLEEPSTVRSSSSSSTSSFITISLIIVVLISALLQLIRRIDLNEGSSPVPEEIRALLQPIQLFLKGAGGGGE